MWTDTQNLEFELGEVGGLSNIDEYGNYMKSINIHFWEDIIKSQYKIVYRKIKRLKKRRLQKLSVNYRPGRRCNPVDYSCELKELLLPAPDQLCHLKEADLSQTIIPCAEDVLHALSTYNLLLEKVDLDYTDYRSLLLPC